MHISFKIINFFISLYAARHVSDTIVLLSRVAKAAVTTEQGWRKQPTQHHTVTRDCMCSNKKLLMIDAMVSETCRAA
jgi:hypothetical protein